MIFLNFMLSNNLKIAGMKIIKIERNNKVCAVVESDETVIADVQSALELLMNVSFDAGTKSIAIAKTGYIVIFSSSAPESRVKSCRNTSITAVVLPYTVISRLIRANR